MERRKNKSGKRRLLVITAAVLLCCIVITAFGGWAKIYEFFGLKENVNDESSLTAAFFSVGCADCCLLTSDGESLLIDSGEKTDSDNALHYMRQNGIKKLNMVIITHFDSDHCNNLINIMNEIKVEKLVTSFALEHSEDGLELIKEVESGGAEVEYKKTGDEMSLGNMDISVLSPQSEYSSENDNSLVVMVSAFGKKLLFTGDAGEAAEEFVVENNEDLKCDILKVSHHGSSSGTSEELLSAAKPGYAVVSVGINSYGLPSNTVISRLEQFGAEVFRTDRNGNVIFKITENEIKVKTD